MQHTQMVFDHMREGDSTPAFMHDAQSTITAGHQLLQLLHLCLHTPDNCKTMLQCMCFMLTALTACSWREPPCSAAAAPVDRYAAEGLAVKEPCARGGTHKAGREQEQS